jgi:hypothetical protein
VDQQVDRPAPGEYGRRERAHLGGVCHVRGQELRQAEQRGDLGDGEAEQQHSGGRHQGCRVGVEAEADQVADAEHQDDDERVPQGIGQDPGRRGRPSGP